MLYSSLDSGSTRSRAIDLGLALGLSFDQNQSDSAIARRVRDALMSLHGLLILDNADTEADVRALLPPAGSACAVIVTSRDQSLLRSVTGAEPVMLDVFDVSQARQCFGDRVGTERLQQELQSVESLCNLLGYLPLAVDVAAATIASESARVAEWANAFSTESDLLDQLPADASDDESLGPDIVRERKIVRAVLRLSLRNLRDEARELLYALSCFDAGAGGSEALIQAVAGVGPEGSAGVRLELNRLHQRSVLQAPTPNVLGGVRYTVHRLMREVARREAGGELERYKAAFFGVFAAFPEVLNRLVSDNRWNATIVAFHQEAANLEAVARVMVGEAPHSALDADELPRRRAGFAVNVDQFASFGWPAASRRRLLAAGLADARMGGWGWLEGNTLKALGDLEMREDRLSQARGRYEEALPIFRQIEDRPGEANTLRALGDLEMREARLSDARGRYQEALLLFLQIEDRLGEANTLKAFGDLEAREARLSDARGRYQEALPSFRQIEDRLGEANTLRALGDLEMREDRLSEARGRYEEALPLFRQIEDRLGEGYTLKAVGDLETREDRLSDARGRYQEALPLFRQIEDRLGEANTVLMLAHLASLEDEAEEAEQGFEASMKLHRDIEDRLGMRAHWWYLGQHFLRNERPRDALRAFEEGRSVLPREGDPVGYRIILEGQQGAFLRLKDIVGLLACLRIQADIDKGLEERYTGLMASIKEQSPATDWSEVERSLAEDADAVRREAVQRQLDGTEA